MESSVSVKTGQTENRNILVMLGFFTCHMENERSLIIVNHFFCQSQIWMPCVTELGGD
jgi:hypothetical protein